MLINSQVAGLALLVSGAIALPNPGSTHRLVARNVRNLQFDNACTNTQRAYVNKAFGEALRMVDKVLDPVTTKNSLPFKTFFDAKQDGSGARALGLPDNDPDAVFDVVRGVFQNMKNHIEEEDRELKIFCGDNGDCIDDDDDVFAWASPNTNKINFCTKFFDSQSKGRWTMLRTPPAFEDLKCKSDGKIDWGAANLPDDHKQIDPLKYVPALTVVHELAHLQKPQQDGGAVSRVVDCYYAPFAAEFMANHAVHSAVANADNYAWFAMAQWLNTLCTSPGPDQLWFRAKLDEWQWVQTLGSFKDSLEDWGKKVQNKNNMLENLRQASEDVSNIEQKIFNNHPGAKGWDFENNTSPAATKAEKKELSAAREKRDALKKEATELEIHEDMCTFGIGYNYKQVENIMKGRTGL